MHSAVIVAGGRSTRFGDDDKAVAPLAGTPMIRRVADRLEPVVDELVVNCREDQREAIEEALAGTRSAGEGDALDRPTAFALDPEVDQGPMAGIRNGCRAAEGEYAAVVACDMPFVDPDAIDYLFDRASGEIAPPAEADDEGEPPFDGAVPRLVDGWYQTTQAVYRPERMAEACDAALERGDRKILAPLEDLSYAVVSEAELATVTDLSTFENLNTQAEFEEAAARLSE
ncbi:MULTISPECIES: molybdenum cofactor guanylyltransferase [Halolamina]|uniref:Probable molybdenum cofactor guanylyltransferase n=1 Tax=Halolamina pelagica TaxID=699431 RepID=A0A1I5V410_9EURY|nr:MULTISPECIES: molybdenum cofactor guanylyltransferase [Halolamina]NHX37887.1 molybdenum cofactor guanylyltransferase [Halolamina sp. R1-12]SFQ02259.1 molybdopterin-guanine dinucleotide biosynthesis protein A [Halolamina pelagica]